MLEALGLLLKMLIIFLHYIINLQEELKVIH